MKVHKITEMDIDRRLRLDRRDSSEAFCNGHEPGMEVSSSFWDRQDEIRDGLENLFWATFAEGEDRSSRSHQITRRNKFFFFGAELIPSERIIIELTSNVVNDRLIDMILGYLETHAPDYCVIASVYPQTGINGEKYMGRTVLTIREIAVEESLADMWSQQVHTLRFEK